MERYPAHCPSILPIIIVSCRTNFPVLARSFARREEVCLQPLKSSIQLKSIPPSSSKGKKKNVVLPEVILGREPCTPNTYVLVPAHQLEIFSSLGLPMPRGPLSCVTGDLCTTSLLGLIFQFPPQEIGTLLAEYILDSIFGLAPSLIFVFSRLLSDINDEILRRQVLDPHANDLTCCSMWSGEP